jgi:hypothetical protein
MIRLQHLDRKQVAVSIPLTEKAVWVYGSARYEVDPDKGASLKIAIPDPSGSFDILISEAEWAGTIERSSSDQQAEYLIRLTAPPS